MSAEPLSGELPFEIRISVNEPGWDNAGVNFTETAIQAIAVIWSVLDTGRAGELSIALISDDDIQALNRDYRNQDKPTNVLSFPMSDPAFDILGDIVLAFQTVKREAGEKTVKLAHHFAHLVIHGFLHLQGYNHESPEEALEMEGLEIAALHLLDIDNPYEIQDE